MRPSKTAPQAFSRPLGHVLIAATCLYAVFVGRTAFRVHGEIYFTLIDDAMISMRYAQHLAAGSGLVWNVGEAPIQGFTNLGWMLFMTLLHLLPVSAPCISLVLMAVCALILIINAMVVARICGLLIPTARYAPLIAAAVTAFYFPLVFWSLRGMEVGLLVLLMDLALLQCLQLSPENLGAAVPLGVILAAALVVRMDALPQVAVILAYVIWARRAHGWHMVVLLLLVAVTLGGVFAFQYSYFGDALPNTYYQKVVGGSLWERLRNGILMFNQYAARDVLMLVVLAAAGMAYSSALRSRETVLLMGLFVVQCLYSVWIGGDYAEPEVNAANRFVTQGMPALIVLFALSIDHIMSGVLAGTPARARAKGPSRPALSTLAALATILVISGTPWLDWAVDNAPMLKADIRRVKAGLAIAENTAPTATIAVHAAGQIPYFSGRRTIDLLGLNDPIIARGPRSTSFYPGHDKWNYEYSIAQLRPDLIADNWIRLGDYIKGLPEYRQLSNGMYIRADTTLVDEAGLLSSYP